MHFLQWFAAAFGGDEVRNGATSEALGALFEVCGCSLLTDKKGVSCLACDDWPKALQNTYDVEQPGVFLRAGN